MRVDSHEVVGYTSQRVHIGVEKASHPTVVSIFRQAKRDRGLGVKPEFLLVSDLQMGF